MSKKNERVKKLLSSQFPQIVLLVKMKRENNLNKMSYHQGIDNSKLRVFPL